MPLSEKIAAKSATTAMIRNHLRFDWISIPKLTYYNFLFHPPFLIFIIFYIHEISHSEFLVKNYEKWIGCKKGNIWTIKHKWDEMWREKCAKTIWCIWKMARCRFVLFLSLFFWFFLPSSSFSFLFLLIFFYFDLLKEIKVWKRKTENFVASFRCSPFVKRQKKE